MGFIQKSVILPLLALGCIAVALGKMTIYSEPGRLNGSSVQQAIEAEIEHISSSILPGATYRAGESFYSSIQPSKNYSILFNLHFYLESFCDPSFVTTVPSASGKTLLAGFNSVIPDVIQLARSGFGSGVVIHGQYQVGYTVQEVSEDHRPGKVDNCTKLTMVYNNTLDYCYGYSSMLQSHTPWNHLYNGCFLRSQDHKYLLQMQNDCNLVLTDTDANKVLWASNTYLFGSDCYLVLQQDMNLVIYDGKKKPMWASQTYNSSLGPTQLIMQTDGYGVMYRNDQPGTQLWGTFNWTCC